MNAIVPVILCGGSGTRLWPRSRAERPKPFLPLLGDRSLFRAALDRCADTDSFTAPLIVAGARHVPLIKAEMHRGEGVRTVVEPSARNTGPAIALAAACLDPDAVMVVCPSDHHIADERAFRRAVETAAGLARQGRLVSLGIAPDRPETGYGYIKRGEAVGEGYAVEHFVEKPDLARAQEFLADDSYSWNGGIFVFHTGTLLDELRAYRPAMADAVAKAVADGQWDGAHFHPDASAFGAIEGESIDYAVMENTTLAAMVPARMGWSDIGNWAALQDALPSGDDGNQAGGRHELVDCRNVLVQSDGPHVSAIGLEDIVIVVDGDEILVTSRDGAQKVGKLGGVDRR